MCVYNEEKTLRNVVLSVFEDHNVNEIIVINDGSSDKSKEIIEELKDEMEIKAIHFDENKGKGYAMAIGVEHATNEIIVFIDADQVKIISTYIEKMISLLVQNECGMVLGYSTVKLGLLNINPLKILTGERVLYKQDIIPILDKMKEARFGVETLMYLYYKSKEKKIIYTRLKGLKHNDKFKKTSAGNAIVRYIKEALEIGLTTVRNHNLILKIIAVSIRNKTE
ncbi:MAG: glycosyltransferase family 2 protein [Paludibacter sp.]|nr:glycosyltransferase family 2 protein [Paludibacter sp.]